jgi:uncharacterized lipoprotein YmbA
MAWRGALYASGLALIATVSACSTSPQPRYYTLAPTATSDGLPPARGTAAVGPVTIPPSLDQPQIVIEGGQNQVQIDEFNRWAGPLNDNIARVVAQNLEVLLAMPEVASGPLANFLPDYMVSIEVVRFRSVRGQGTQLEAIWTVRSVANGAARSGHTTADETVSDESFAALAAAHSRALTKLSQDIASAIRLDAGATT